MTNLIHAVSKKDVWTTDRNQIIETMIREPSTTSHFANLPKVLKIDASMSPWWRRILMLQCTGSRFHDRSGIIYPLNGTTVISDFRFRLVSTLRTTKRYHTQIIFRSRCTILITSSTKQPPSTCAAPSRLQEYFNEGFGVISPSAEPPPALETPWRTSRRANASSTSTNAIHSEFY